MIEQVNKTIDQLSGFWLASYLAGLIEGNGRFYNQRLEILFPLCNKDLAEKLARRCNGQCYDYRALASPKPAISVFFTGQSLATVIGLTNGFYVKSDQLDQIKKQKLDSQYNIKLKPCLNKLDWDSLWLAGFFEVCGIVAIDMQKVLNNTQKISVLVARARSSFRFYHKNKSLLNLIVTNLPSHTTVFEEAVPAILLQEIPSPFGKTPPSLAPPAVEETIPTILQETPPTSSHLTAGSLRRPLGGIDGIDGVGGVGGTFASNKSLGGVECDIKPTSNQSQVHVVGVTDQQDLTYLFNQLKLFGPFGFKRIQLDKALQCFQGFQNKPLHTIQHYRTVRQLKSELEQAWQDFPTLKSHKY
jgi:hypothetical protein